MNWLDIDGPVTQFIYYYVFYYPFLMAYVWMGGGIAHAMFFERKRGQYIDPLPLLPVYPRVSVIVPCFNESRGVRDVIEQLMRNRYPDFEVLAVNDGSADKTGEILEKLSAIHPRVRVIHHAANQGKAVGLNTAALLARGEYILGIDGDALVDRDAIAWMMVAMMRSPKIGAVTGNPRIRTRTSLIGRMQVGEFSSTIGLIKRTQQLAGRLFTVSGVLALFRRKALLDAGFWSPDVMAEDIDVSWKVQLAGWRIRYEPRAISWILMPETVRGLFRQRQRWAVGGVQTLIRHTSKVLRPRNLPMWPIYFEYLASLVWAYAMLFVLTVAFVRLFMRTDATPVGFWPQWHGVLLGITCMLQMAVSLWIDRHYDRKLMRYLIWAIWYPSAFWVISTITSVLALPIVMLRRSGKRAVWTSPDRGEIHERRETDRRAAPE